MTASTLTTVPAWMLTDAELAAALAIVGRVLRRRRRRAAA